MLTPAITKKTTENSKNLHIDITALYTANNLEEIVTSINSKLTQKHNLHDSRISGYLTPTSPSPSPKSRKSRPSRAASRTESENCPPGYILKFAFGNEIGEIIRAVNYVAQPANFRLTPTSKKNKSSGKKSTTRKRQLSTSCILSGKRERENKRTRRDYSRRNRDPSTSVESSIDIENC